MRGEPEKHKKVGFKAEYLLIAFIGSVMMLLSSYTQWISTDLSRYSITYYWESSITQSFWWASVGLPFLVGSIYFFFGVSWSLRDEGSITRAIVFFASCFVLGLTLLLASGFGIYASIFTFLVFLSCMLKIWSRNKRHAPEQQA